MFVGVTYPCLNILLDLEKNPCIFSFIMVWQLAPRGHNHAMLIVEDLILMYCIMNRIKVNRIYVMKDHMNKF